MQLTTVEWNLDEASFSETRPPNATLGNIANALREAHPDIVLLSEVKNWDGPFGWTYGGVNQAQALAKELQMGYQVANVNTTGLTGHKAVAVLSKYLLTNARLHMVSPGYGIIQVDAAVPGYAPVVLFSLRFDHASEQAKIDGCRILRDLVEHVPSGSGVIIGGDFNAHRHDSYMDLLMSSCGLVGSDTFVGRASNPPQGSDYIDFILSRGAVRMVGAHTTSPADTSGHPMFTATFEAVTTTPPPPPGGKLRVQPVTIEVDKLTTFEVAAFDQDTQTPVDGDVVRDGTVIGRLGGSITATFHSRSVWVGPDFDDRGHPIPGTRRRIKLPPVTSLAARAEDHVDTPIPVSWAGVDAS